MRVLLVTCGLVLCTIVGFAGDQRKPQTHTVTIEGMRFQPEALTVARGDTIGAGSTRICVPHTATSKAGNFDSNAIQVDESWRYTVQKKGDLAYICTLHPTMKAMLRVD